MILGSLYLKFYIGSDNLHSPIDAHTVIKVLQSCKSLHMKVSCTCLLTVSFSLTFVATRLLPLSYRKPTTFKRHLLSTRKW